MNARSAEWDPDRQLDTWLEDIHLMKSYATSEGLVVPPPTASKLALLTDAVKTKRSPPSVSTSPVERVATIGELLQQALEVHGLFATLVAPANPRTLRSNPNDLSFLARVRANWLFSFMMLSTLVAISLFISAIAVARGSNDGTSGWVQVSWVAGAILGASFNSLYTASSYLVKRSYDPGYDRIYITRFVLGIVAGTLLANLGKGLFGTSLAGSNISVSGLLFSVVGGYTAEAVNQILLRVGEILVAVVKGGGDAQVKTKENELKTVKNQAGAESAKQKAAMSDELSVALDATRTAKSPEEVRQHLEHLKRRIDKGG